MVKSLTKDNKSKIVKLRGLPFNVTEDGILEFFKDYNIAIFVIINRAEVEL